MIRPAAIICLCGLPVLFFLFNFASWKNVYFGNRLAEIEKVCGPFLSSANSELQPDDDGSRGYRIKNELSFFHGDWAQEIGKSPLVPFDDSDLPWEEGFPSSYPLRLVGFEVTDVNPVHLFKNAVSLCGTMCIGMAMNSSLVYDSRSDFCMSPGVSVLNISFEGVYVESQNNGGQRLLCMLGNNFTRDRRLLLVLRYPQISSLTKRAILGELTSLNDPGKPGYFEPVHITSQLNSFSVYEFSPETVLKSKACNFDLYLDEVGEDGATTFSNAEICKVLRSFSGRVARIGPNWRFSSRGVFESFFSGQEVKSIERSYKNVRLMIQNIICEEMEMEMATNSVRVAAVLRVVPSRLLLNTAKKMTGLSGMTLSVEGTGDVSKGKLCMVGCPGVVKSGIEGCDSQVSLYFPRSFSIKQRSIILGSISSFSSSYDPIFFDLEERPSDLKYGHDEYLRSYLSYNFSKIELARNQLPGIGFISVIKQLFLSYPGGRSILSVLVSDVKPFFLTSSALQRDRADLLLSHQEIISLSGELSFYCYGIPVPFYPNHEPKTWMKLEVLTFGPLISGQGPWLHFDREHSKDQVMKPKSGILNVSLSLIFPDEPLKIKDTSTLFLEGLYDTTNGRMHLIGCRKITVLQPMDLNLESGLDCLIEVKIAYAAKTMRWLINPKALITISSQRSEDDTLFFQTVKLEASMLRYGSYDQDAVFRKIFEEILRILMMVASIVLLSSQLLYMKENVDGVPYVSSRMFSFQCAGYLFPVIFGNKVLFPEKEYHGPFCFHDHDHILTLLDYTGKLLALFASVMAAALSHMVAKCKRKSHLHLPADSKGVVSDKMVSYAAAAAVASLGIFLHYLDLDLENFDIINATGDAGQKRVLLKYKQLEFLGYLQDLFLHHQIIKNMILRSWEADVRPLRKVFYMGFTLMRIGIHLYDNVRDPLVDPLWYEPSTFNLLLFFNPQVPNIAVVVVVTGFALLLYIQQKESQEKLSKTEFQPSLVDQWISTDSLDKQF